MLTINAGDWTGTLSNAYTGTSIVFGSSSAPVNQPYLMDDLKGWKMLGTSPLGGTSQIAPKSLRDGSWKVPHRYPYRDVTMILTVTQASAPAGQSWATTIGNLEAATISDPNNTSTLTIQLDGIPTTVTGTVIARDCPTDFSYQFGFCAVSIVFRAFDPKRLAPAVSGSTGLPSSSGGISWPVSWPISWPSTITTGSVQFTSPGNAPGPVTVTFYGGSSGVSGPSIGQTESGLTLSFSNALTIQPNDWLTVDMDARTALYNGQASRANYLLSRGWQTLLPGTNTFTFNATSAYNAAPSMTVTAAPAYL